MSDKIISIKKYKKSKKIKELRNKLKNPKMLFFIVIIAFLLSLIIWKTYVENIASLDVNIPKSDERFFSKNDIESLTASQISKIFNDSEGRVVILHLYTTWCKICHKNMPIFNELAKEFQNSNIEFISIAIDKNLSTQSLIDHLNRFGRIYFKPFYLSSKFGFLDLLKKKGIKYNGKIPYTVLINKNGEVELSYSGLKSKKYLRNKIVREVFMK
jgi:thiol-disulfide isomerase/thioredoxin